ncbi:RNA polymerase sigma factor [Chryseobacterium sp. MOF25P]|uniref:RNA polymerase sigma factor n=1 Tax=unclassified Chryseobacterium TaxID=2593645 RepID=UPI000805051B|nr:MULTISPECIES: sigma-70 family RNA polymerase sigma factor [unclassified Chryseobacterium]OBW41928.1 RNA polymerase sigma factor [Chryseobacterium sp. MOF25P]OBW45065.1 RNA polymerase sigma factor [Chryseobacterium sp. BGARF1]
MNKTDLMLLKKIRNGDQNAFSALYQRYYDSLYKMVFIRTRDKYCTEELLQNLWLKVFENPEFVQVDETGYARKYFFRYMHFRVIDAFKADNKSLKTSEIAEESLEEISATEYFQIFEENDIQELFRLIKEVLYEVSDTEQKVYDLRIRQNKSVKETAQLLGVTDKTVHNKLNSVLTKIRNQVEPRYKSSKNVVDMLIYIEIFSNLN